MWGNMEKGLGFGLSSKNSQGLQALAKVSEALIA
jgi:hypothetical protein